jgi:hypothetical protein
LRSKTTSVRVVSPVTYQAPKPVSALFSAKVTALTVKVPKSLAMAPP